MEDYPLHILLNWGHWLRPKCPSDLLLLGNGWLSYPTTRVPSTHHRSRDWKAKKKLVPDIHYIKSFSMTMTKMLIVSCVNIEISHDLLKFSTSPNGLQHRKPLPGTYQSRDACKATSPPGLWLHLSWKMYPDPNVDPLHRNPYRRYPIYYHIVVGIYGL